MGEPIYSAPQTTIAGLRGPTSKRERGGERGGKEEGQGEEGKGTNSLDLPLVEADREPMTNFPCGTKSTKPVLS